MQDEHGDNGTQIPVPWTVGEVFVSLFLVYAFWPPLVFYALQHSGFYLHFYGPDLVGPDGMPLKKLEADVQQLVTFRLSLWAGILAFPLQMVTIPFVLNSMSGTRLERLGLTTTGFGRNIKAGAWAALVLTPALIGLNVLVTKLFQRWNPHAITEHPFTRLAEANQLLPVEWALLVVSAVVTAPIFEELVFRGLILRWFTEQPLTSHLGVAAALFFALSARQDQLQTAWKQSAPMEVLQAASPALFVLALVPVYALVWRRARSSAAPALVSSSLAFAALHSAAWPQPIALFVLALGLGALALRGRSLVGPITLHALFNGTSCVLLFFYRGGPGP